MTLISRQSWIGRTIVLWCVVLLPFVRFLLYQRYGFFYPEVLVPLGIGLLACAISGVLLRWRPAFGVVVVVLVTCQSAFALHSALESFWTVSYLWIIVVTFEVLLLTWMVTKDVFFRLVVMFSLGMFGVAVAQSAMRGTEVAPVTSATPMNLSVQSRVVYVIFDEFLGLAGFPRDIPECVRTAGEVQSMLLRYGFDVYPNAYSNYFETLDSIPSILNFKVGPRKFLRKKTLTSERLFSEFRLRGYHVAIYQSDFLSFRAPSLDSDDIAYTYEATKIRLIKNLPIGWQDKALHIVGCYIQSDAFFREILTRIRERYWFSQGRFDGPLSVSELWPDRLRSDILNSRGKMMFFAHLLTPHHPYVFDGQDRLRDYEEWGHGFLAESSSPEVHRQLYRGYCEQVRHLAHQMDGFLEALKRDASFDSTIVIFHGDHGSRLELADHPEVGLRNLLDGYSTLFAIKPVSQRSGRLISRKASVLRLLANSIIPTEAASLPSEVDDIFLTGDVQIPILNVWREDE